MLRFRWVACQIDALELCRTDDARERALKSLPKDLPQTYERIIRKIDPGDVDIAVTVLTWLCVASKPLSLDLLANAAAIIQEDSEYHYYERRVVDPSEDILEICGSLVHRTSAQPSQEYGSLNIANIEGMF